MNLDSVNFLYQQDNQYGNVAFSIRAGRLNQDSESKSGNRILESHVCGNQLYQNACWHWPMTVKEEEEEEEEEGEEEEEETEKEDSERDPPLPPPRTHRKSALEWS